MITDKAGKTIPCMDYYIGICPAPCLLQSDKVQQYSENIERVKSFYMAREFCILDLENQMRDHASKYEFEKAQEIKETIEALRGLYERQKVRDIVDGDIDICVQYEKYEKHI